MPQPRFWLGGIGLALIALLVSSCEDRTVTAVEVAGVSVSPQEESLARGQTTQLTAAVLDARGEVLPGRQVAWSSDDEAVATVDGAGVVEALSVGSTRVVARAGGAEGHALVTVTEAARIALSETEIELQARPGEDSASRELLVTSEGAPSLGPLELAVVYDGEGGWLAAELDGSEAPTTVTLRASARSLDPGSYEAELRFVSPAAENSPLVARVVFRVDAASPSLRLSTTAAGFSWEPGTPPPPDQTVRVTSANGSATGLRASVSYGGGEAGWLDANLQGSSTPADLVLAVAPQGLPSGVHEANVTIRASGVVQAVGVRVRLGVGAAVAELVLERQAVAVEATEGSSPPGPIRLGVESRGTGELGALSSRVSYESGGSGWLEAELSSWTAPSDLVLRIDHGGLSPGEHRATAEVHAEEAINSPQSVAVTLEVSPAGSAVARVARVEYARAGGNDRHLDVTVVLEDEDRRALGGAVIGVEIRNVDRNQTWVDSGSTRSDGSVRFRVQQHPDGCYETTVRSVEVESHTWDGNTPGNGYCRDESDDGDLGEDTCGLTDAVVDGDLGVPDGATCSLTRVRITGNLVLGTSSSLVGEGLQVAGNLQADGADRIVLRDSLVDGNVQIEDSGDAEVRGSTIDGNVQLQDNRAALDILDNRIDGDLQASNNAGGPFTFSRNVISGNLQCRGNDPPPEGGGNQVQGDAEGQCREL